jgi:hypothetical protein
LVGGNNTATVGSHKARLKIEGAEQIASRVWKRNGGRPSNKFRGIRKCGWREELDGTEFHDLVEWADRVAVPLRPPTALRVTKRRAGGGSGRGTRQRYCGWYNPDQQRSEANPLEPSTNEA